MKTSIIIPVLNRPNWLKMAVESVLAQTYPDFELIVVDDGSTENLDAVKSLVTQSGHHFIRLAENRGVSAARNWGVAQAKGQWLAFLDSDDRWLPTKLEKQMAYLTKNPAIKICQTDEIWYRHGVRVNRKKYHQLAAGKDSFAKSLRRCSVSPSSVIIARELFLSMGGFDERLVVCEDYDLWLKITSQHPVGFVDEPLIIKQGGHADQLSRSQPAMDRFRLFSLLNLRLEYDLTPTQQQMVLDEIIFKTEILYQGAVKRENPMAEVYQEILTIINPRQGFEPEIRLRLGELRDRLLMN